MKTALDKLNDLEAFARKKAAEGDTEAQVLVFDLPPPVDPLLLEAREWCLAEPPYPDAVPAIRAGEWDDGMVIRAYLAGARAQIAKQSTPQLDADGWIPHKPGDPMPCDGEVRVDVETERSGRSSGNFGLPASYWQSGADYWRGEEGQITAWRPVR